MNSKSIVQNRKIAGEPAEARASAAAYPAASAAGSASASASAAPSAAAKGAAPAGAAKGAAPTGAKGAAPAAAAKGTAPVTAKGAALPPAHRPVDHPVLVLMGLYLGSFTGMYSETACNIALPQLAIAFSVDVSLTQWFVISYMLAIGLVLPFSSLLTKWFSSNKLSLFALVVFAAGALVTGFSNSLGMALAGRALQGASTGIILPLMFSTIVEVVPPHRIGAMMGTSALVVMLATVIGPTLAGLIVDALSWRWVFFSFVGIILVAIVFQLCFHADVFDLTKPSVDKLSAVLSCVGFGGVVLGAGMASSYGWLSLPVLVGFAIGVVSLVVYARRQLASKAPILNLRALKFTNFRIGCLMVIVNFAITLDAMYVLPQLLQNGMGLDTAVAGLALLPGGIVNCLLSVFAGRIYDRVGARIPVTVGFALILVGSALFLQVTPQTPLVVVIVYNMVVMAGVPLVMSPSQSYTLASLPPSLNTDGSTILNTLQQVCGAIATAIATSLMVVGRGSVASVAGATTMDAFASGAHLGYLFALILGIFGLAATFRMRLRAFDSEEDAKIERESEAVGASAPAAAPSLAERPLADVRSLMHSDVYTLRDDQTALDALTLFADKGISGAPIVNKQGVPVGFVTDGNVMENLARQTPAFASVWSIVIDRNNHPFSEKLAESMSIPLMQFATKRIISVDIDADMSDVCEVMVQNHLKKIPVMEGGRMVGMLNRSDITRYAVDLYRS